MQTGRFVDRPVFDSDWKPFHSQGMEYVLLFFLLYPQFRESSAALAILPVAI